MKLQLSNRYQKLVKDCLFVTVGAFLIALGINVFFLPNHIVSGGMNGVSIVVNYLTGLAPATFLFLSNIPLLILSLLFLGKDTTLKTIYGALALPFFIYLTASLDPITKTPLLAALFGGIVTGVGLGVVFKGNASTGGTAILSQIVHKYIKIPLGLAVAIVDGTVILSAFITFTPDATMYSLMSLFVISRMIDLVQTGFNRSKNVWIISEKANELQKMILKDLDQGVTAVPTIGGYNEREQLMLMCVLPEKKFPQLKELVLTLDPNAFVVCESANEVMGLGFSLREHSK